MIMVASGQVLTYLTREETETASKPPLAEARPSLKRRVKETRSRFCAELFSAWRVRRPWKHGALPSWLNEGCGTYVRCTYYPVCGRSST